jgi:uncharacterized phage protein (TIGR02220 family)
MAGVSLPDLLQGARLNYYPHHIGDYDKDTKHLSMLEDAAYRRMIDVAYATEKPLPRDQQKIYRLVRARTHAEQLAVDVVLGEFWTEGEDGWHNKRVEEEIAKAQAKSDAARNSAAKRWHSDGNANAMRTHSDGNAPNNHKPRTKNQKPKKIKDAVGLPPDDAREKGKNGHDELHTRELRGHAVTILEFLNEKAGKNYQPVKTNIDLIVARLKEGGTVEDMRAIVAKKCREWQGRDGMEEYLRPATLFGAKNFWQKYQGELAQA